MYDIFGQVGTFGKNKLRALLLVSVAIAATGIFFFNSHHSFAANFNNPLVDAADLGDIGFVEKLLKQGELPDSKGDFGTTALMRAAFRGNTDLIKLLMENGAYVNAADIGGETALHLAAKNGHDDAVNALLHYGAYIDVPDKDHWTPLMRATLAKQPDTVKALVAKGADVSAVNNLNESVLVHAAIAGMPDIAAIITGSQKAQKITSEQQNIAIGLAKRKNHNDVEKLLEKFAGNSSTKPHISSTKNEQETTSVVAPAIPPAQEPEQKLQLNNPEEIKPTPKTPYIAFAKPAETAPLANDKPLPSSLPAAIDKPAAKPAANLTTNNNPIKPSATPATSIPITKTVASGLATEFFIQLGNFNDDNSAELAWDKMLASGHEILQKLEPTIVEATISSKPGDTVYRLRAGTMTTKTDADKACKMLRDRGQECYVVEVTNVPKTSTALTATASTTPAATPTTTHEKPTPAAPPRKGLDQSAFTGSYPKLGSGSALPPAINIAAKPPEAPLDLTAPAPTASSVTQGTAQAMPWQQPGQKPRTEWRLPEEPATTNITTENTTIMRDAVTSAPLDISSLPPEPQTNTIPPATAANSTKEPLIKFQPPLPKQELAAKEIVPSPLPTDNFAADKEQIRNEIQEMNRTNFFRKQGVTPPKRSKKEYDDFYKQVENSPKESTVTEAVLVPDESYFSNSNSSSTSSDKGSWLNISNLPNEAFANDYGIRMFKYDESLGNIQILITKPVTDSSTAGAVTMRVGPLLASQASNLCNTVKAGGYGCSVSGNGGSTAPSTSYASSPTMSNQNFSNNATEDNTITTGHWINLGTFSNSSEAEYYWMFIKEDNGDIVNSLQYDIAKTTQNGEFGEGAVKLRTGPFSIKQRAAQICNIMRYRNIACLVGE